MRTLVLTLSPDLNNTDICDQKPVFGFKDITLPEPGEKILAFEFDRLVAKTGKQYHMGAALLSEIEVLINKFEKQFGQASMLTSQMDITGIYIKFFDDSEIQFNFIDNYTKTQTWIKPKKDISKLIRGYTGTFQYVLGDKKQRFC